jgi:hypothetical protein
VAAQQGFPQQFFKAAPAMSHVAHKAAPAMSHVAHFAVIN